MAETLSNLSRLVTSAERFEAAYGMSTHWLNGQKINASALGRGPSSPPPSIEFIVDETPDLAAGASEGRVKVTVPFTENPVMLGTPLHDVDASFNKILSHIDSFPVNRCSRCR